jgi:hypothetical protein
MNNQDDIDPYATPQAETIINPITSREARFRVEKNLVAIQDCAKLPKLCFLSGDDAPTALRTRLELYWINPMWGILIWIILPIFFLELDNRFSIWVIVIPALFPVYLIVYHCLRKKVTFDFHISPAARKKRWYKRLISAAIFIICVLTTIYCFTLTKHHQIYFGLGVLGALISPIVLFIVMHLNARISVKKHKHGWFYITGAGKNFLKKAKKTL